MLVELFVEFVEFVELFVVGVARNQVGIKYHTHSPLLSYPASWPCLLYETPMLTTYFQTISYKPHLTQKRNKEKLFLALVYADHVD